VYVIAIRMESHIYKSSASSWHFSQTPEKKFALDRNWDIIRLALISMDC